MKLHKERSLLNAAGTHGPPSIAHTKRSVSAHDSFANYENISRTASRENLTTPHTHSQLNRAEIMLFNTDNHLKPQTTSGGRSDNQADQPQNKTRNNDLNQAKDLMAQKSADLQMPL